MGRFPFNKNFGLKFRKFHVINGTVAQTQTGPVRSSFLLVSRIQKSGTRDNSFVKGKGTFRPER